MASIHGRTCTIALDENEVCGARAVEASDVTATCAEHAYVPGRVVVTVVPLPLVLPNSGKVHTVHTYNEAVITDVGADPDGEPLYRLRFEGYGWELDLASTWVYGWALDPGYADGDAVVHLL